MNLFSAFTITEADFAEEKISVNGNSIEIELTIFHLDSISGRWMKKTWKAIAGEIFVWCVIQSVLFLLQAIALSPVNLRIFSCQNLIQVKE